MAEQSGFFTWIFTPQESPSGALQAAERRHMAVRRNISMTANFILVGFSEHPELQVVLFVLFLGIYSMTLAWNLGLIVLIRMESCLHSPMYFFLGNLSFVDISYTSSIAPKMLCDFFKQQKTISFVGCAAQFFFFIGMGGTECCLLAAMAYDRYVAISNPLLYTALMSPTICVRMVITAYTGGFLTGLVQTSSVFQLHFCGPRVIDHFFCDLPPLLVLSCSSTFLSQVVNFLVVCAVGGTSALVVLVSYGYIIAAVMKIHSTQGRMKAFNTCASHLTMPSSPPSAPGQLARPVEQLLQEEVKLLQRGTWCGPRIFASSLATLASCFQGNHATQLCRVNFMARDTLLLLIIIVMLP
uniref:G-protein coupled receptors family 1 profile domain-containing protein n=1 Tax=Canis lupus familiaris TaxID=9615 RepID=A0A8C0SBG3_CANLF